MRGIWFGSRAGLTLGLLLVLTGSAWPAQSAGGDEALRERVRALNALTGNGPVNGEFKALLDDPKGTKGLLAVAKSMVKKEPKQFTYFAAFVLGQLSEEHKDVSGAAAFYRICVDRATKLLSARKLGQAYLSLIALYYDNQKFEASAKVCKEFLEFKADGVKPRTYLLLTKDDERPEPGMIEENSFDPLGNQKPGVHRLMIRAIAKQGKFDDALKLANNLIKARPDDWLDLELKGWVYREAGRYKDAAKVYQDVIEQVTKDKELEAAERDKYVERYRYGLSNIYVEMNRVDKATEQLQLLLAKKPNDPTYNNDLGYIWADHDMKLAEAEKLIRKALEEERKQRKKLNPKDDRDNGAYLDSLGWVLYKQKKYKEAREALVKAVEDKISQHIEIYDHLGDVYWALNEKAKAVEAWKKGLGFVGASKRDQDRKAVVEKKLKARQ